jgi:hypothetical protein
VETGANILVKAIGSLSYVLNSSKGRDKILALIQYVSSLYKNCMKDFLAKNSIRKWPVSVRNAKAVETSMQSSRKIFRFLRWLEVLVSMEQLLRLSNKPPLLKLLIMVNLCASYLYYVLDNIVWAVQIGIVHKMISNVNVQWRSTKDVCAMIRRLSNLTIRFLDTQKSLQKESTLISQLQ